MAVTDTRRPTVATAAATTNNAAPPTRHDYAYAAFWLLRILFGVVPIVVGIDKYFDNITQWDQYLWVGVSNNLHLSAESVMHIVGPIEIVAGLLVLFAPRLGSIVVAGWLTGIVANLLLLAHDEHEYWDIALRDASLAVGAVALALLAFTYRPLRSSGPRSRPAHAGSQPR